MKNKLIEKTTLAILVVVMAKTAIAASLPAQIPDKYVDNFQVYGEKYHCDIATKDQKKYSLDLVWSVVPNAKARFPVWNNSLSIKLLDSEKLVINLEFDNSSYNDLVGLNFKYIDSNLLNTTMNAQRKLTTRGGVYLTRIELIMLEDANQKIKLSKFFYSHNFTPEYSTSTSVDKEFNLDIADSQCEKL